MILINDLTSLQYAKETLINEKYFGIDLEGALYKDGYI